MVGRSGSAFSGVALVADAPGRIAAGVFEFTGGNDGGDLGFIGSGSGAGRDEEAAEDKNGRDDAVITHDLRFPCWKMMEREREKAEGSEGQRWPTEVPTMRNVALSKVMATESWLGPWTVPLRR